MATDKSTFSGAIVVASRIVDFLSSGLYESPAACLKELVNNAYDADATRVDVFVKPDANRIIISDNGHGMDKRDFEQNFSKISESFKRESGDHTASGRKKIGKIGIGFIAANEICEVMQIISTKKGSTEKINVEINFHVMRLPPEQRRKTVGTGDFSKGDYVGRVEKAEKDEHYTHIFLKEVRGPAKDILSGARSAGSAESLYGLSAQSIAEKLSNDALKSWDHFDLYSQTMLQLSLTVPVPYAVNWAGKHADELSSFTKEAQRAHFLVSMDGTELRKPTVLATDARSLVEVFNYKGADVSFKAYFYAQHGVLRPQDLNGVLVRIRGAAIGDYDTGFLGFSSSVGTLFQRWISAEIWADDRLEDAMNIDRKTLRITHPAYVELEDAFRARLELLIGRVRKELYEIPAAKKKRERAKAQRSAIEASIPKQHRTAQSRQILAAAQDTRLNRSFKSSELIEIAGRVAARVLDARTQKKFMAELLSELLKS
jgi:hypothetical protein